MDGNKRGLTRRVFLKKACGAAAGGLLATAAVAGAGASEVQSQGPEEDLSQYDLLMPRVKFDALEGPKDYWTVYPEGDLNILRIFASKVRCRVKLTPNQTHRGVEAAFNAVVDFKDLETLLKYPFIFMTSQYRYELSEQEKENLKRYIYTGGFLFMDDCIVRTRGDFFYQSSYKILDEVFGKPALRPIPVSHEVFHNVYDFGRGGVPHCHGTYHPAQGVFVGDRLAVFLSSTDIHCAWVGNHTRVQQGIEMGINILMYALTH